MGLLDKIKESEKTQNRLATGIGAFVGGPVGALGGLATAKGARALSKWKPFKNKPVKTARELLAKDIEKLKDPQAFGLSDAERQRIIADAAQQDAAARQSQVSELGRQALAGQGFQAGAFQQAQEEVATGGERASAGAAAAAADLNQRMVEQGAAQARARLDAERERVRQNTRFWLDMGIKGASAIVSAAVGGGLGIPMPSLDMGSSRDLTPQDETDLSQLQGAEPPVDFYSDPQAALR
jgi:hypothetical protein